MALRLSPCFVTESAGSELFCVRFSPDAQYLATSCGNGAIRVYNSSTGAEAFRMNEPAKHSVDSPSTVKQIRWRPLTAATRTKNVLVSVGADGIVKQWHITSGRCLQQFGDGNELGQLYCLDYAPDGTQFAAGGERKIFVYDEATKRSIATLEGGDSMTTAGHSNRIFALKFHPSEKNIVVSAGWDNSVQVWDLRVSHAVRAIYGPHISGDALDVSGDGKQILTGSWRAERPLEIWDFLSGEMLSSIPWRTDGPQQPECLLYAAQFSKDPESSIIAAGGSRANEAKVFDRSMEESKCLGTVIGFTCLSTDFSAGRSGLVAFGGSDGSARVMKLGSTTEMNES